MVFWCHQAMTLLARLFRKPLAAAVLASLAAAAPAAISIDHFAAATNDRFANNPAFVAAGQDLSGVGRDAAGRWATMIEANIFVSATHYHPAVNSTISFYPGNDPSATPVTRTVSAGQQISGTDLWIGHFEEAVPSSVAWYPFATTAIDDAADFNAVYLDDYAYQSGISPTTTGYGASNLTDMAVGENHLEFFVWGQAEGGSTGDVMCLVRNVDGDSGYTYESHEALLQGGDSGSPLLLTTAGGLQVAGTAWAIDTISIPEGTRWYSVYTYTGNYTSAIQTYIDANLVPEPSVACLVLLVPAVVGLARRR